ncbi:MAG: hypothetical protein K0R28_1414 [Paenibacillus sp.]|nr:hypothetical protein [Paenibacillus sp.]
MPNPQSWQSVDIDSAIRILQKAAGTCNLVRIESFIGGHTTTRPIRPLFTIRANYTDLFRRSYHFLIGSLTVISSSCSILDVYSSSTSIAFICPSPSIRNNHRRLEGRQWLYSFVSQSSSWTEAIFSLKPLLPRESCCLAASTAVRPYLRRYRPQSSGLPMVSPNRTHSPHRRMRRGSY